MSKVDQFESIFRSAAKEIFHFKSVEIRTILVVTDLDEDQATRFSVDVKNFLKVLESDGHEQWHVVRGDEFSALKDLLDLVEKHRPDLICTYRHLHSKGWRWAFSLGEYLDVLTQATEELALLTWV